MEKPKGAVRVVGEDGSPGAYSLSQRLAHAFEQSGWTVTTGSVEMNFYRQSVFVLDHKREVSKYSSLIREALFASGAEFVISTVHITERCKMLAADVVKRAVDAALSSENADSTVLL